VAIPDQKLLHIPCLISSRVDGAYTHDHHPPPPRHIMHRFWEIDGLVRIVATDLEERCMASASAVALACCSKRLADIVLDPLWEQLDSLSQSMKCLPQDTWEIRDWSFVSTTRPSPFDLGAHWSIGFLALPHHRGMDQILDLCSEGTRVLFVCFSRAGRFIGSLQPAFHANRDSGSLPLPEPPFHCV